MAPGFEPGSPIDNRPAATRRPVAIDSSAPRGGTRRDACALGCSGVGRRARRASSRNRTDGLPVTKRVHGLHALEAESAHPDSNRDARGKSPVRCRYGHEPVAPAGFEPASVRGCGASGVWLLPRRRRRRPDEAERRGVAIATARSSNDARGGCVRRRMAPRLPRPHTREGGCASDRATGQGPAVAPAGVEPAVQASEARRRSVPGAGRHVGCGRESGRLDSNQRPPASEAGALPTAPLPEGDPVGDSKNGRGESNPYLRLGRPSCCPLNTTPAGSRTAAGQYARLDSNQRPSAYQADALPAELRT